MKKFYVDVKGGIVVFLKSYGLAIVAAALAATFVFAALSYHAGDHLLAISGAGLLAAIISVVQTARDWKSRINRKGLWRAVNTLFVGIAIHHSAIIIGVSFGAVFSVESGSTAGIAAVLIQQAVLSGAAWLLVNEYRRSSAR